MLTVTRPEGCAGTLSFDSISLGGSWRVDSADGAPLAMSGMGDSISLCFVAPRASDGIEGYRYRTQVASYSGSVGSAVRLTLNGTTVWTASSLADGQRIEVPFTMEDIKPGVNELAWHLDAVDAGDSLSFAYHRLKMMPSATGMVLIIR